MFATKQVFVPDLEGKAIVLKGLKCEAKSVLVMAVNDDVLKIIDKKGIINIVKVTDIRTGILSIEILEPKIPLPIRTAPGGKVGRKIYGKQNRSWDEIKSDEEAVLAILSGSETMLIRDILNDMKNKYGRDRWSNKNASGFIGQMIRKGLPIEKVDYGRYRYTGGGTV